MDPTTVTTSLLVSTLLEKVPWGLLASGVAAWGAWRLFQTELKAVVWALQKHEKLVIPTIFGGILAATTFLVEADERFWLLATFASLFFLLWLFPFVYNGAQDSRELRYVTASEVVAVPYGVPCEVSVCLTSLTDRSQSRVPLDSFIPSDVFAGARAGYFYTSGKQGRGYYPDALSTQHAQDTIRHAFFDKEFSPDDIATVTKRVRLSDGSSHTVHIKCTRQWRRRWLVLGHYQVKYETDVLSTLTISPVVSAGFATSCAAIVLVKMLFLLARSVMMTSQESLDNLQSGLDSFGEALK